MTQTGRTPCFNPKRGRVRTNTTHREPRAQRGALWPNARKSEYTEHSPYAQEKGGGRGWEKATMDRCRVRIVDKIFVRGDEQ